MLYFTAEVKEQRTGLTVLVLAGSRAGGNILYKLWNLQGLPNEELCAQMLKHMNAYKRPWGMYMAKGIM